MYIFTNLLEFKEKYQQCVATIGKYDGMHLGHQSLLRSLLLESEKYSLPSIVILSEPQPEEFFRGDKAPVRLNQFRDKVEFLKCFGVDGVYCMRFNKQLSQMPAEEFVESILHTGLGVKSLIIGDDFHFGKNRQGDFTLLATIGKQKGFDVQASHSFLINDERVSSSLVRKELKGGNCEKVSNLLGRPYCISGEVVYGKQLGRELGTKTANIALKGLALQGIFIVKVLVQGKSYQGVASIGYNPTIDDEMLPLLEVHLLKFNRDIYGENISVEFLKKIRDEQKFSDLTELKKTIAKDIEQAQYFFKN